MAIRFSPPEAGSGRLQLRDYDMQIHGFTSSPNMDRIPCQESARKSCMSAQLSVSKPVQTISI